jgi:hypothetical protein
MRRRALFIYSSLEVRGDRVIDGSWQASSINGRSARSEWRPRAIHKRRRNRVRSDGAVENSAGNWLRNEL